VQFQVMAVAVQPQSILFREEVVLVTGKFRVAMDLPVLSPVAAVAVAVAPVSVVILVEVLAVRAMSSLNSKKYNLV
jgi:hypothetical protein